MHSELPRLYRRPGSLLYWVDLDGAHGPVGHCLETANLELARRRADELRRPSAHSYPAASATSSEALTPGTVHWALAEHIQRAAPDLSEATRKIYLEKAGQICRTLGAVPITELTRRDIDRYHALRAAERVSDETIRKELVLLRAALKRQRDHAQAPIAIEPLFPRLRTRYVPRRRWLEPQDYADLIAALPAPRALFVQVACYTGARLAELYRLDWADIDWQRRLVFLRGTKTDQAARTIPLRPELLEALRPHKKKQGPILAPWSNLYRDLALACEELGIAPVTPNDLRRTFASWLVQAEVPTFTVAKLLGHSTEKMIHMVYGHLTPKALHAAVDRLPEVPWPRRRPPTRGSHRTH